jgi:lipopolysaccharide transport system ATP-binding protein
MIAIDARNITKTYKLYQSPTQRIREIILRKPYHTQFTALEHISFSIMKGETFGIIGENGAGKSTLLKILAKTLKPTSGEIWVEGRSAALLELGAGFNPELTGEENIYLNAYLLGLSKREIDEKKQEIIAFSELEEFIKRPVKTFSSGMHVRLAFSIATTVNPEVLIIDEALSVGDEYFQKKCMDRMMNFRQRGKTIVFCSHSMYYIQELCQKAMWLHKGKIKGIGEANKIIVDYQNYERDKAAALKEATEGDKAVPEMREQKTLRIADAKVTDGDGREAETFKTFDDIFISFKVLCPAANIKGHLGFCVIRNDEIMTFGTTTQFDGLKPVQFSDGQEFRIKVRCTLLSGMFTVLLIVADEFAMHPYDMLRTRTFSVFNSAKELGMAHLAHEWLL